MPKAFTLPEVMLALVLVTIAVLALLGLCAVILKDTRKAGDLPAGSLVADQILTETLYGYLNDVPAGSATTFWAGDFDLVPFAQGVRRVGRMDYNYALYAQTVPSIGTTPANNRLKRVDVNVSWMGGAEGRQGYGRLSLTRTRLVHEP